LHAIKNANTKRDNWLSQFKAEVYKNTVFFDLFPSSKEPIKQTLLETIKESPFPGFLKDLE
jgi:hypothetical protein